MVYTPESECFKLGMVSDDMPSTLTILNHGDTGSLFFDQLISGGRDALEKDLVKNRYMLKLTAMKSIGPRNKVSLKINRIYEEYYKIFSELLIDLYITASCAYYLQYYLNF